MSVPAGSKVPCPVHMHMHPHFAIGPDSPEKGFQKGYGYEKHEKWKKETQMKQNAKTNKKMKIQPCLEALLKMKKEKRKIKTMKIVN